MLMRILYYLRGFHIGGAETFVFNVLEKINTNLYHIDFVIQDANIKNESLFHLCKEKGATILTIPPFEKHPFKSISCLKNILNSGNYNILHFHANSLINITPYIACKRTKTQLVVHSHNSGINIGGFIGLFLHRISRFYLKNKNISRLACSDMAGKWMFGKQNFSLICNGVNAATFAYSSEKKDKLKKQLGLAKETLVIGHVGRFVEAKNHEFLIQCFKKMKKIINNIKLVLLGDGPLFNDFKEKYCDSDIFFVGNVQNTYDYYSLFDEMIFPSLFEGLPFVLVEAQASGLPILASDTITKEVNVTDQIRYYSLNEDSEKWALNAFDILNSVSDSNRDLYSARFKKSIFNSDNTIKQLTNMYNEINNMG